MSNKCYLCGRVMTPKGCESDCMCHDEHIIPNAIGGKLKSPKILCKQCGSNYGDKEDQAFVKLFSCFVFLIEDIMHFDRHHNGVIAQAYDYNSDKQKIVKINHEGAFPINPCHIINNDDKTVTIYGHKETTKYYKKRFDDHIENGYTINVVNNINGLFGVFFSEKNEKFNEDFKKGIVKIAVEFALHSGVGREIMNLSFRIKNDGSADVLYDTISVLPYIPCNNSLAILFEEHRLDLEKDYPSHSLRLFNIDKYLYCYVGLFSTFQYYVVLSDQYSGEEIDKCYYQSVLRDNKDVRYNYTKEELSRLDMSDLDIVVRSLGVDTQGKKLNEIYEEIDKKQKENLDYDFRKIIEKVFYNIINRCSNSSELEDVEDDDNIIGSFKQMMRDFNMNKEEYINFLQINNDFSKYLKYNTLIDNGKEILENCVLRSEERIKNNMDYVKQYTNKKFELLQKFCNTHKLEKSLKKVCVNDIHNI